MSPHGLSCTLTTNAHKTNQVTPGIRDVVITSQAIVSEFTEVNNTATSCAPEPQEQRVNS